MTQPPRSTSPEPEKSKLPPRDWLLLPLLGLLTVCLVAALTEFLARRAFSDSVGHRPACSVRDDNPQGARATPNSICWEKPPEGSLTRYDFNRCGDRAGMECGVKPPGVYRIVVTGTSVAEGRYVPREQTVAVLLPTALSRLAGRPVDLYNASAMQGFLDSTPLRLDDLLANKPDMILWLVTPLDVWNSSFVSYDAHPPALPASAGKALSLQRALYLLRKAYAAGSVQEVVRDHFNRTRTAFALRHLLFESQSQYVKSYLMGPDSESGYLKSDLSPGWRQRLQHFDQDVALLRQRAAASGVQLAVALIPYRAQAAMVSMGRWPAGYNPYRLDNEMRAIVTRDGALYLDILPGFRAIPNPERDYFPVDGHPNARGEFILARLLADRLFAQRVPAPKPPGRQPILLKQERK